MKPFDLMLNDAMLYFHPDRNIQNRSNVDLCCRQSISIRDCTGYIITRGLYNGDKGKGVNALGR